MDNQLLQVVLNVIPIVLLAKMEFLIQTVLLAIPALLLHLARYFKLVPQELK